MTEPRNVEDVDYAETPETTRPMREVIRDRTSRAAERPRAIREAAYRERAGIQAMAGSCICTWPLEKFPTESEHAEWCVSHGIYLSRKAVEARYSR